MKGNSKYIQLRTCKNCGNEFLAYLPPSYIREGRGKTCSRQCAGLQSAKVTQADIPKIIEMGKDLSIPTRDIAAQFGCSLTKIRKILREAGCSRSRANVGPANGMFGRTHTPEARAKIREANRRQFANKKARQAVAERTAQQIAAGKTGKTHNKLETLFASILDNLGIEYTWQYRLGRYVYDFYLPESNTLIEVHGTFWHADPRFYPDDLSEIQQNNVNNDKAKTNRARKAGYRLLTFWEHDIHNSPQEVVAALSSL